MKRLLKGLRIILTLLLTVNNITFAKDADFKTLDDIKVSDNSISIILSGETKYNAFKITNPPRIVLEFTNTEHNWKQKELEVNKNSIKRIRSGQFQNEPVKIARVVIDLDKMVEYEIKGEGKQVSLNFGPQAKAKEKTEPKPAQAAKNETKAKTTPAAAVTPPLAAPAVVAKQPVPATGVKVSEDKEMKNSPAAKEAPKAENAPAAAKKVEQKQPASDTKPADMKKDSGTDAAKVTPVIPAEKAVTKEAAKPVPEVVAVPISKAETQDKPETARKEKDKSIKKEAKPAKDNKTAKTKTDEEVKKPKGVVIPTAPVTLDFEQADIKDVLRVLSMKSGINIIYSSDVEGFVTLRLENVPFDKALDTILSLNGLVSQEQGPNILRITTPEKISKERSQAVTFTKIFPLNYANGKDVKSNLDSVRSAEGRRGNISVDDRTNSLIVTDTPEGLVSIERLIIELDKKPQQVLIEAKIVEVNLTDSFDMGIQWQYAGTPVNTTSNRVDIGQSATVSSDGTIQGTDSSGIEQRTVNSIASGGTGVAFPAAPAGGQAGSITFGIVANNNYFTGVLTTLAQKGLSKLLSNPKVTTINNKEAKILIGQKVPYTTATTISGNASTQNAEFLDVGIQLTVTPTINVDKRITLDVNPVVSLFIRADPAGPVVGTREAKTTVLVKDGETVVIGGLITEEDRKLGTQVPLLGDLPVIGHLFRRDYKSKERTELLVFVTPQIIE